MDETIFNKMVQAQQRAAAQNAASMDFIQGLCDEFQKYNYIDPAYYERYNVKRGLRNADGTGVMDGEKIPAPGQLIYRGIDVEDLIEGFTKEKRFGFEETAYLLLFGALPTQTQLEQFGDILAAYRTLPPNFTEDMILKAPSHDVMNKLARAVLALYSYDPAPEDHDFPSEMLKALKLVARFPMIVAHAYAAKRHYYDNESLYLHRPQPGLSVAENFLYSVRHDNQFSPEEAKLLDLCLVLHMEHGGGNNSAFACRVLSSSGTDIYSSVAAAVGSLKGPKHGGANMRVMDMFTYIERDVKDWKDDEEISAYLSKIIRKETGDGSGLIYGMGHAVYSLSDPRAVVFKSFVQQLAEAKGRKKDFDFYNMIERLAPQVIAEKRHIYKGVSTNVDFYSGFVYNMLDIPLELYTPIFAIARIVGWSAHRMEELVNVDKIIRPAYESIMEPREYIPLEKR